MAGWLPVVVQAQKTINFIENKGQWPEQVKFSAEIPGGVLFVGANTLTYAFADPQQRAATAHSRHLAVAANHPEVVDYYALKVSFLGADPAAGVTGKQLTPALYSYFLGNDARQWAAGARGYRGVVINGLYPGIDLEIYADARKVKYDLRLAPGADPACVQMYYQGAEKLVVKQGVLTIHTPFQTLEEHIPASYALCEGNARPLPANYRVAGELVSFAVGPVAEGEAVVIDPLLVFSTYSGSEADNWGNTATFDAQGNGYAGGMTQTTRGGQYLGEFPATPGAYQVTSAGGWDVAILKFDSAGQNLLYATHLGGSGTEVPQSLLVNEAGELLILGITGSRDFPVTANAYDSAYNGGSNYQLLGGVDFYGGSDIFVAKLSADGSQLLASTYIGGTGNDGNLPGEDLLARNYGDESRGDINFDSRGNIIIASRTGSNDFPAGNGYRSAYAGGATDAVVFKLSAGLDSLLWGTYLGGNGTDVALSVKIDSLDNIFVAGGTSSADFPVTATTYKPTYAGNVDGWVAHLTGSGDSLIAGTFIGTTGYDQVFFLDLDAEDEVYLAGQTDGNYLHTSGTYVSGYTGQFIHKLSGNLQTTRFSTTINTRGRALPALSLTAFLVNDCDNIYLSGWGSDQANFSGNNNNFVLNTLGLPITQDAYQATSDGSSFYLMVLSGDARELLYATHLGDANSLVHVDGGTSRFDKHGIVYHSVCASCFGDSSFPTTEGAYAPQNGSTGCNNALFKFDLASLRARLRTNSLALDNPGLTGGCLPLDVVFENLSTGGEVYEWDFGDGRQRTVYSQDTLVHQYTRAGTYRIRLRAYDPNTCIAEDFAYARITVSAPDFAVYGDADICFGSAAPLLATGGQTYLWSPTEGLDDPTIPNPVATPADTTVYKVRIYNTNGCDYEDSVTVNVVPEIGLAVRVEPAGQCEGSREIVIVNESEYATKVRWDFGDGGFSEDWQPVYTYAADGQYQITGKLANAKCAAEVRLTVDIQQLNIPNVLTRNADGLNDVLTITSANPVDLKIFNRWGALVYQQRAYQNNWQGTGLPGGIYYYEVILANHEVCTGWVHLLDGN